MSNSLNTIIAINNRINLSLTYRSDWPKDYWQTLAESLELGRGDCEDYACAKFHLLTEAGLNPHLMACYINEASHMVCVCDGYVLDNVNTALWPLEVRSDLSKAVYELYIDKMVCKGTDLPVERHSVWIDWIERSGLNAG